MANELIQFLLQYILVVFACSGCYFFGRFLLNFFGLYSFAKHTKWLHSYAAIVLGIVIPVLVYSIILTGGKTINILILPVLLGLFYVKKKAAIPNSNEGIKHKWPIVFFILAPFFLLLLFHLFPESEYKQSDSLHYLQISQSFNNFGGENTFGGMSMLGSPFRGTLPYHYFEFWINAILLKCCSGILPGIQILRFICYGIISTGGFLGLFALAENMVKGPLSFFQQMVCASFIFYIPNFLDYVHFFKPFLIYPYESNILERPNLRILYLFLPGIFMTFGKDENKWPNLFWMVCTIVSSLVHFVVLVPATFVYCLIAIQIKWNKQAAIFLLIGVSSIAVLYLLFYHFTTSSIKITPLGITKNDIAFYYLKHWKLVLFSSITSILYCLFIPAVLLGFIKALKPNLFLWSFLKQYQIFLLFACAIIFCAMIIARALNFMDNAYQFAFVGYAVGAVLFFALLFAFSSNVNIKKAAYCFMALAFVSSYIIPYFVFFSGTGKNVYSQSASYNYGGKLFSADYLQKIASAFPSGLNVVGAFWADSMFYEAMPQYSTRNPNAYSLPSSYILAGKTKCNFEVCLSDSASIMYKVDTTEKLSYDYLKTAILYSPFYNFRKGENINDKRLAFIKQYKLQYLILTKNADTSVLNKLMVLKRLQDYATGERFYLIGH